MKATRIIRVGFAVLTVLLLATVLASAHGGIAIDGSAGDWANLGNGSCPSAPGSNSGSVLNVTHTDCGLGANGGSEFVWTDATGDQRTDHYGGSGDMDLTQFRVTGDATNLYFLLRFSDITNCNAQYIAIAINSNDASGTTFLPDGADTNLGGFGNGYERTIEADLNATGYWSNNSTYTSAGSSFCSIPNDVWEISMPISSLGLTWPAASGAYDFAVAIFCHDSSGGICDVSGSSDAMDVITTVSGNTFNEVGDGSLDYNFSMGFNATAVTLAALEAQPGTRTPPVAAMAAVALVGLAGLGISAAWRGRQQAKIP